MPGVKQLIVWVFLGAYLLTVTTAVVAGPQAAGAGRSVWDGVFTDAQADRGRLQFSAHCASCHGATLQGGEAKALGGERFWTDWKETTVEYLFNQIRRNMPFSEDGSLAGTLPGGTYADIVAHILKTNGFPSGPQELTAETTAGVRIIAKDGPGELPAGALAHVVGCLARGADGSWRLVNGSAPVRVLTGQAPDARRPLGSREYALMFVITRLDKFVGHRMSATGRLMGEAGAQGINVTSVVSVAPTCE